MLASINLDAWQETKLVSGTLSNGKFIITNRFQTIKTMIVTGMEMVRLTPLRRTFA